MQIARQSIPGVYRRPAVRRRTFRRPRTDVLGIVGVAGPRHLGEAIAVDDWESYVQRFLTDDDGDPIAPPRGAKTADTVFAFFANGGARCVIVNVAAEIEEPKRDELLNEMLGLRLPREPMERVGLELLLLADQVALIALPELDATWSEEIATDPLPPSADDACFVACTDLVDASATPEPSYQESRLFDNDRVLFAQAALITRLRKQAWRWFAVLAPPPALHHGQAIGWKRSLVKNVGRFSNAAMYWPWLRVQTVPGDEPRSMSPIGYVAGAIARRDLAEGPHVAPANLALRGAVGVELGATETETARLSDAGVNLVRATSGYGIEIWGARTLRWQTPELSTHDGLAYVNVRRCLTAIERTVEIVGRPAVFEPNLPILRLQLTQVLTGYLMGVFESGALAGQTSAHAFRVRCDAANNPPEATDRGELLCEIDVAIAKAAEFIEFRVGRQDGVVEIEEPQ